MDHCAVKCHDDHTHLVLLSITMMMIIVIMTMILMMVVMNVMMALKIMAIMITNGYMMAH